MSPLTKALFRIKRGLAGYVSYLAACDMNQAFSEYVLYEPILRILTSQGYKVRCECVCPGFKSKGKGDKKRIDFVAKRHSEHFAMEVKWAKSKKLNIKRDVAKLYAFRQAFPRSVSLLCIFGRESHIETFNPLQYEMKERGKAVYAPFRITRYGCRIFALRASDSEAMASRTR
jgi:Holliday junction resolvase